ncbi:hypothetical protein AAIR29_09860 [Psychrobacter sp. FBL11]|uniref:Uncharacterized protein n=1 Tax=Psychrobacter saeujeotis TaxID=3143436 RepID=A0ABU9X957_9GAMM|nr:hypothetical protein [uncultured Psychrobacter sp.]
MGVEQAEEIRSEAKECFNESMGDYNLQFVMQSHNQNPLANKPYVIYDGNGEIFQIGKLDDEGQTPVLKDGQEKEYFIHVLDEEVINE